MLRRLKTTKITDRERAYIPQGYVGVLEGGSDIRYLATSTPSNKFFRMI